MRKVSKTGDDSIFADGVDNMFRGCTSHPGEDV